MSYHQQGNNESKVAEFVSKLYGKIRAFIAVSLDPLFLYVPVIKEDKKCIVLNKVLWNTAIVSRSVIDVVFLVRVVLKLRHMRHSVSVREYLFVIMFTVLVGLPIPQVVMPIIFSEMRRTKSSNITILNSVILLQYGARLFQSCLYWKHLIQGGSRWAETSLWIKVSLNLFPYILLGHVLGAFWYFFSAQRLTACWHKAYEIHGRGTEGSFDCDHGFRNVTFLVDFCPIDTPNPSTFDFGIFLEARRSGILESMGFLQKVFYCFSWGMRNLSSFGSNLQTSSYIWENIFALGISIFGLLLFLYFTGNLQLQGSKFRLF